MPEELVTLIAASFQKSFWRKSIFHKVYSTEHYENKM